MNDLPHDLRKIWHDFLNNASQEAPAYGVLKITGSTAGVLQAARPNGAGNVFAFNYSLPITATTGNGICTQEFPCWALYDDADGTPAAGQVWAPGTDTFKLRKYFPGPRFMVLGEVDTTNKLMKVVPIGRPNLRGKLDGTLSENGSATMSIWSFGGGSNADTGVNVTVYDDILASGQTITSGKVVHAGYEWESDRYYVFAAECAS